MIFRLTKSLQERNGITSVQNEQKQKMGNCYINEADSIQLYEMAPKAVPENSSGKTSVDCRREVSIMRRQ